ncbi:MAG TPA: winged helix-turn-helix domain-containing protein [Bryobacteraceae bacterium]|nr:winged helix-turn-helix domain-containing protein [Bryobacteraceae bacterium]
MQPKTNKLLHERSWMNLRFEDFEVNFNEWEIRKRGIRIRLQRKPFQILRILLERPGELVTRSELAAQLWPGLHVEFERSLNTAINCLRQALGDSSRTCRFIETRPGLGYRFIGAIEPVGSESSRASSAAPVLSRRESQARPASAANPDYLKGVLLYNKMTAESLLRAATYFESARGIDPKFAPPYAGLADVQNMLGCWSLLPTKIAGMKAKSYAEHALQIDAGLPDAHAALATAARLLKDPVVDVEDRYRTALELDDASANTRVWYGDFLCARGRFTEAIDQLREAQQLDPISLVGNFELAWVLYVARDFRSSLTQSWNTLMLEPSFAPAQYTLGLANQQLDQLDEAVTEFENAWRCSSGHPAAIGSLGCALAKAGQTQDALRLIDDLDATAKERYVSPYWYALVYAGLEDFGSANAFIQKMMGAGDILAEWYPLDPRFDAMRAAKTEPAISATA